MRDGSMIDARDALGAIGLLPDEEIDLADAALQIARLRNPGADWARAGAHLSELAREAAAIGRAMSDRPVEVRLGALAGLIHARHLYEGDLETFDDLANADLIRVTERRRGLPVALAVIWLHCIRAAGWRGVGLDAPGHFLIRLDGGEPGTPEPHPVSLVVDVFSGGIVVDEPFLLTLFRRRATDERSFDPTLLRPIGSRGILLRLQRNIAERERLAGRLSDTAASLEIMSLAAPQDAPTWRQRALLNQQLGRFSDAITCFERFLAIEPTGIEADRARIGIGALRRRLA